MITTFCPRCGSENPFDNRFCGKCGIPLLQPKPAEPVAAVETVVAARANGSQHPSSRAERDTEVEQTISGPSFLGLSDEPDLSSSYLLDEETPRSHWGVYLFLIVLVATGGLVWWQARKGGLNRTHLAALVQQARGKISQEKQEAAAVAPNANPAAAENAGVTNPAAAPGSTAATPPAAGNPKPAVAPPPSPAQIEQAAQKQDAPAPAALEPTTAVAKPPTPSCKAPARARAAAVNPAASADAQSAALIDNAQKYLYGEGVPQSCDRALSYLRQAVDSDSAKAKSILGGMYATGHCVPLDRSVAYKWMALALRQKPNDSYLSHNLEMLWNQMTPEQKQLAIRMTQ